MALQIDLENSAFGIPFEGAYFRVMTTAISRERSDNPRHTVMIDAVGYAAKPQNEDTREVDFRRYHAPLCEIEAQQGSEFLQKVYHWLSQQPDMTGSVAV
jgi:hypothetical protein